VEWKIRNFKSIDEASINLDTSKNAIIAGPNSSGKSSIIQSILLAAQSSQYNIELNGHLFSFGDPMDVIKDGENEIVIEHESLYAHRHTEKEEEIKSVVHLKDVAVDSRNRALGVSNIELFRKNEKVISSLGLSNKRIPSRHSRIFREINESNGSNLQFIPIVKDTLNGFTGYVGFSGFEAVVFGYISSIREKDPKKFRERLEKKLVKFLREDYESYPNDAFDEDAEFFSSPYNRPVNPYYREGGRFIDFLSEFMREGMYPFNGSKDGKPEFFNKMNEFSTFENLYNAFKLEKKKNKNEVYRYIAQSIQNPESDIHLSTVPPRPEYVHFSGIHNGFYSDDYANDIIYNKYIGEYKDILEMLSIYNMSLNPLRNSVKYLGPVRNSPRAYYERSNNTYNRRNSPIGINGEYVAEYIDSLNRRKGFEIKYINPEGIKKEGLIQESINEWVKYVGIGENVKVRNISKIGYSLTLEVKGRERDLTSVGVGVSQALPVIVALLTCEPGDIFLVEQPELHLHPDAQARLADFLITARPDVCVIAETHSDSILARIRRRVIENRKNNNTGLTNKNIDIIFVKPEDNGSVGEFIEMSDLGKLDRWPEGFLNGTIEDLRAIFNVERSIRNENKE
jgi:hypothetical protein